VLYITGRHQLNYFSCRKCAKMGIWGSTRQHTSNVAVVQLPESHSGLRTWRKCHDRKLLPARLISWALTRVTFAAPRRKALPTEKYLATKWSGLSVRRREGEGKRDLRERWPALWSLEHAPPYHARCKQMGS